MARALMQILWPAFVAAALWLVGCAGPEKPKPTPLEPITTAAKRSSVFREAAPSRS